MTENVVTTAAEARRTTLTGGESPHSPSPPFAGPDDPDDPAAIASGRAGRGSIP